MVLAVPAAGARPGLDPEAIAGFIRDGTGNEPVAGPDPHPALRAKETAALSRPFSQREKGTAGRGSTRIRHGIDTQVLHLVRFFSSASSNTVVTVGRICEMTALYLAKPVDFT